MEPAWCQDNELLSSGSMASSGTNDGCVLELRHHSSLPHITIKSEACVPDYNASSEGSPCMPPFHSTQVTPASAPVMPFGALQNKCTAF